MWVGNILKTIICYIPLVSECHFIAATAIFRKIMKFFKKSDFFFVFKKKNYLGWWKVIEIDSGDKNRLSEGARVKKLTKFGFFRTLRGF